MQNYSSIIKTARKNRRWTQQALASHANVTRKTIIGMENGEFRGSVRTLEAVISTLGYCLSLEPIRMPTIEEKIDFDED